ncbi:Uncharacterized protein TCM_043917 [Theobroma cacao]|uniref:Uncharacterized protein n=1 Tax=Theobroma cacao TaxID=3641 RepID=A0A061FR72_THECC|nr:Uncharacterized protein TCM_043917 [Theobroma cacao]
MVALIPPLIPTYCALMPSVEIISGDVDVRSLLQSMICSSLAASAFLGENATLKGQVIVKRILGQDAPKEMLMGMCSNDFWLCWMKWDCKCTMLILGCFVFRIMDDRLKAIEQRFIPCDFDILSVASALDDDFDVAAYEGEGLSDNNKAQVGLRSIAFSVLICMVALIPLVILAYNALMPSVEITLSDVDVRVYFNVVHDLILCQLLRHEHDLFLYQRLCLECDLILYRLATVRDLTIPRERPLTLVCLNMTCIEYGMIRFEFEIMVTVKPDLIKSCHDIHVMDSMFTY